MEVRACAKRAASYLNIYRTKYGTESAKVVKLAGAEAFAFAALSESKQDLLGGEYTTALCCNCTAYTLLRTRRHRQLDFLGQE